MPGTFDLDSILSLLRTRLCTRTPFLGSLILFAETISTDTIPTAATNGRQILINPQFFERLTLDQQEAVLLHEVLHAALLHVPRGVGRDAKRWNIAADVVVNGILTREGFALPKDSVRVQRLEHFSVEEVYDLLGQSPWDKKNFPLGNPDLLPREGMEGEPVPTTGSLSQEQMRATEAHWRNAMEQASIMAETLLQGSLPASLQRELQTLKGGQLNWRHYLWRYLVRTPIDFREFDRRFIGKRMYLETLEDETVFVAVAVDTSGSIDDEQIRVFLSEVQSILLSYPQITCQLYYADADLHGPYTLSPYGNFPTPVGGGGTDFRPFFTKLTHDHSPWATTVAVYLTDGYGYFPSQPPSFPVLWVVTPGGRDSALFPFGETVRLLGER
ncbi:MAG TPA: VWA-like domain-containing protein [Anaerolineales bacterium]|nr:VWA-like domain-containing protein [Anaerolineales bacterium]